jgi:hypothetical protein
MQSFNCLLVQGGNLDNGTRDILYMSASAMLRKGKNVARFRDEMAQGKVTTEGRRRTISSVISGIEFSAIIDCRSGNSVKCRFLVDDRNLIPDRDFHEDLIKWTQPSSIFFDEDASGEE